MEIAAIVILVVTGVFIFLRYRNRRKYQPTSLIGDGADKSTRLNRTSPLPVHKSTAGQTTVTVSHVHKSFNDSHAVNDVSFEVSSGEILGMVGPNGAGKTTAIRLLMDIIRPDSGRINILGIDSIENARDHVGYLPEERGLYRKVTVVETLQYLARLKGLDQQHAKQASQLWLERMGMTSHRGKSIEQLSKGMSQIIQLAATIIHDPDIIILDEPFSGLDPVNRGMLKEVILELKGYSKTIILSTHQMNEVEAICDRVLMINHGQVVLYGELHQIRSRYRNNSIFLEYRGELGNPPGLIEIRDFGTHVELFLDDYTAPQQVLNWLVEQDVLIDRFELSAPSLDEIFVKVARGEA